MTVKHMRPDALNQRADYNRSDWDETLDPSVTFEDIFVPGFWAHHREKLRRKDILRLTAHDWSFDVFVTVKELPIGGVVMKFLSGQPPIEKMSDEERAGYILAERSKVTVVPFDQEGNPVVRVQHLPATKWRVLGISDTEVIRELPTRAKAEEAMAKYLDELQMRMPTAEEIRAHKAQMAKAA